ncbi:MAG: hypothetical protein J0I32_05775 [Sphingobacteriales bacterium]|nr:hypothetical protein [Sphingobacteriales bacterium]OJW03922.1 MAG: hypothetical protein BGO52_17385 [Sphingobacteriales bacterium 44-61]
MDLVVIPECFVDTNLTETLVPPKRGYNHQHGCGTVARVMIKTFSDSFAVGIIDKDKQEIDYLKQFEILVKEGNLFLHKHKTRHHYIIQISPAMERFILDNAEAAGINLEDFGLPSNLNDLKDIAKTTRSKNDHKFRELFKAIRNQGAREFELLASWISYLKEHTYKAEAEVLRNF